MIPGGAIASGVLCVVLSACADGSKHLLLGVTTSTRDSGILDVLLPAFEAQQDCRVDVIAAGTGRVLRLAEGGDLDAVLVHDREAELAFLAAGHAVRHEAVMSNRFALLGPPSDPAEVRGTGPAEALARIRNRGARFLSRGDDSGTHRRERSLWKLAGGQRDWDGFAESGQGMGPTLVMASQMRAYVLSDRGTWLNMRDRLDLEPLVTAGGSVLDNLYGVLAVHPGKNPRIEAELAQAFIGYLASDEAQALIGEYRIEGEIAFYPRALSPVRSGDPR